MEEIVLGGSWLSTANLLSMSLTEGVYVAHIAYEDKSFMDCLISEHVLHLKEISVEVYILGADIIYHQTLCITHCISY